MWRVLGNASQDDSSAASRQPKRKTAALASAAASNDATRDVSANTKRPVSAMISKGNPDEPAGICGKYRITGVMRKGATGYLYSAVAVVRDKGEKDGDGAGMTEGVVLKVEECAAPKRQMQNEWAVRFRLQALLACTSQATAKACGCLVCFDVPVPQLQIASQQQCFTLAVHDQHVLLLLLLNLLDMVVVLRLAD